MRCQVLLQMTGSLLSASNSWILEGWTEISTGIKQKCKKQMGLFKEAVCIHFHFIPREYCVVCVCVCVAMVASSRHIYSSKNGTSVTFAPFSPCLPSAPAAPRGPWRRRREPSVSTHVCSLTTCILDTLDAEVPSGNLPKHSVTQVYLHSKE